MEKTNNLEKDKDFALQNEEENLQSLDDSSETKEDKTLKKVPLTSEEKSEINKNDIKEWKKELSQRSKKAEKISKLNKNAIQYIRPVGGALAASAFIFITTCFIVSFFLVLVEYMIIEKGLFSANLEFNDYLIYLFIFIASSIIVLVGFIEIFNTINYMIRGKGKWIVESLGLAYGLFIGGIWLMNSNPTPTALMLFNKVLDVHNNPDSIYRIKHPNQKPKDVSVILAAYWTLFFSIVAFLVFIYIILNTLTGYWLLFNFNFYDNIDGINELFFTKVGLVLAEIILVFISLMSIIYTVSFIIWGDKKFVVEIFGFIFGFIFAGIIISWFEPKINQQKFTI